MKIMMVGSLSLSFVFLLVGSVIRADTILSEQQKIIATSPAFDPHFPFGIGLGGFPKACCFTSETGPFVNLAAGDEIFLSKNDPLVNDIVEFLLDPVGEKFRDTDNDFFQDQDDLLFVTPDVFHGTPVGHRERYPRSGTEVDGIFIKVIPGGSGDVRAQFGFFGENVPELGTGPSLLIAAGLLALAGWRRRGKGVTGSESPIAGRFRS